MKKIIPLMLCTVTAIFLTACGGQKADSNGTNSGVAEGKTEEKADTQLVTGMIAYAFGTQSFADDVLAGLVQAKEELGIPHYELEIADVSETASGFRTLIQQGANFVVASSAEYCDGMLEVAGEYPDVYFLYLAEYLPDSPANVISFEYRENEAAFLAGALGGMKTKSNKIGAVLAMSEPLQLRYQYGYMAGAKAVNPDCEVMITFTNSYADTNIGYEHANAMYSQGCDFVGCYSGACNLGVFQAAEEAGDGNYCFGAANGQFDKSYEKIIASVVKPVNEAIAALLRDAQSTGKFDTSISSLGIKEEGVKLLFTDNENLLSLLTEEEKKAIEDLSARIVSGELKVPGTEADFNSFSYTYEVK
ncbi:MAG: BMP family ABC transporter substrate-binding protein [Hungatella sp.]|nr:BMP family ABC transporter substrate-binding protein [Hungatella sp.]